ncbi:MAG: homoserine O-succinyltransferase [Gemmatimonadetes bacterium]|nr:homoserine O-succinyltransferase [Gemmatimonadota bacterium]
MKTETEIRVVRPPRRSRPGLPLPPGRLGPVELELELEGRVMNCDIGFECIGPPDAPAVVALGGISADAHVSAHDGGPRPGWWEALVGPGRAIDTERCRVIGMDWLGGTGDTVAESATAAPLPAVTTRDQADLLARLLDGLGIERVRAVVGASYGGMVALAFAARYPRRLERAVVISAAHQTHPMATALRSIQREIVRFGLRTGREAEGLALARELAVTTYRTAAEFHARFGNGPVWERAVPRFPVETYLRHQGRRFADRFTAERYLRLSESLDLHAVDPARILAPVTLVSVREDTLVPPWQMEQLLTKLRGRGELVRIRSRYGHDAFLKETASIGRVLESTVGQRAANREVAR